MKHCDTCRATFPSEYTTCPKDGTPLRVMSELTSGTVIRGKYEIIERIGAGGMATVYKAKHLAFHETVALKVVSSKLIDDAAFLKRFKTEAVVTRKLQHPNAVQVEDFDTLEDGRPFMALEFVAGKSLRAVLVEERVLAPARAIKIAQQIAAALGAAHASGITHRDIKPDNVLLVLQSDGSEFVKVLDFGIAKVREGVLDQGQGYTATQTGLVVGTPQYLSPEQAMGKHGDAIDGRADIYALGIVLYEMLAGELPFRGDTAIALLLHHMNTVPTPVHELKPELNISGPLSAVLVTALEKDPAKRYQTAEELQHALSQAEASLPALTSVIGSGAVITPPLNPEAAAPAIARETAAWPASHLQTSVTPTTPLAESTPALAKAPAPAEAEVGVAPKPAMSVKSPARFTVTAAKRPATRIVAPKRPSMMRWVVLAVSLVLVVAALAILKKHKEQEAVVTASPGNSDQRILAEVHRVLAKSEKLQSDSIAVQVQGGVVSLDGAVRSKEESDIAFAVAEGVDGVVAVQNHLTRPELKPAANEGKKKEPSPAAPVITPVTAVAAAEKPAAGTPAGVQQKKREFVQAMLTEARQHMQQGEYQQALNQFNRVLAIAPTNAWAQEGKQRAEKRLQRETQGGTPFRRRQP